MAHRNLKTRLYFVTVTILLVGLASALSIYLTAESDDGSGSGYELPTTENSKMYVHDLELYGGKANVLAEELRSWFTGLWHGKSLAFTIACITIFVSYGFFFVANHLASDSKIGALKGVHDAGNKSPDDK